MVDSAKGITNLHAPNDVIVDARCVVEKIFYSFLYLSFSQPVSPLLFAMRYGDSFLLTVTDVLLLQGMWNKEGKLADCVVTIPDRYQINGSPCASSDVYEM
jgi:hypothetical protein